MNSAIPLPVSDRFFTMVSVQENNNKYYHMHKPVGDTFDCEYGRINGSGFFGSRSVTYPVEKWDSVYASRIDHGYSDISELYFSKKVEKNAEEKSKEKPVKLGLTANLMALFRSFTTSFVRHNYNIGIENITEAMVRQADIIIEDMEFLVRHRCRVFEFNEKLCELWRVIPRSIENTRSECAQTENDFAFILKRESSFLDTLRGNVKSNRPEESSDDMEKYCQNLGLEIREVNTKEKNEIISLMDNSERYVKAYRVVKCKQEKAFKRYAKEKGNVRLLFHGTKNENLFSIISNKLLLNPHAAITGKMFGNGIYFANSGNSSKSTRYTSINGSYWAHGRSSRAYLLMYDVALGNVYNTSEHDYAWEQKGFHQKYDSLHAHAGKVLYNDEIITYSEDSSLIRYIIEIR